jgi:hypothetical protein
VLAIGWKDTAKTWVGLLSLETMGRMEEAILMDMLPLAVMAVMIDVKMAMRQTVAGAGTEALVLMVVTEEMTPSAKATKPMASAAVSMVSMAMMEPEMLEHVTRNCKKHTALGWTVAEAAEEATMVSTGLQ